MLLLWSSHRSPSRSPLLLFMFQCLKQTPAVPEIYAAMGDSQTPLPWEHPPHPSSTHGERPMPPNFRPLLLLSSPQNSSPPRVDPMPILLPLCQHCAHAKCSARCLGGVLHSEQHTVMPVRCLLCCAAPSATLSKPMVRNPPLSSLFIFPMCVMSDELLPTNLCVFAASRRCRASRLARSTK
jgi:hypothetical protein